MIVPMGRPSSVRRPAGRRGAAQVRKYRPGLEAFERRELMAVNFLQGVAYLDNNGNNQFDAGDAPKVGVTIQLRDTSGSVLASKATNAEGYYRFNGVAPGSYRLVELTPYGRVATGTQVSTLINSGSPTAGAPGSIDVTVAASDPANLGIQRIPGIPGGIVGVPTAFNFAGDPFATYSQTSDPLNAHQFEVYLTSNGDRVSPNFYSDCIDLFHGAPRSFAVSTSTTPAVSSSYAPPTADRLGRMGYLYNHHGQTLAASGADAAGLQLALWELLYDSSPSLTSGNFAVNTAASDPAAVSSANAYLTASAGKDERAFFLNVVDFENTIGAIGSQGMIATESFNFANQAAPLGSIGDRVWIDANANGLQDGGELGLGGVPVSLRGAGPDGQFNTADDVLATTSTDVSGLYLFDGLVADQYQVTFGTPAGYTFTTPKVGTDDAIDSDANPATGAAPTVTLGAGQAIRTVDAGVFKPGTLSGQVVVDAKRCGTSTIPDAPLAGVTVTLTGTTGAGASITRTAVTGNDGRYAITGLIPGTYQVAAAIPAAYDGEARSTGSLGGTTDDVRVNGVVVTSGATGTSYDFVAYAASISGTVYRDLTGNGLGADDAAFSGVTVKLYRDANGNGVLDSGDGAAVASMASKADGSYSFDGRLAGTYFVQATTPNGFVRTEPQISPTISIGLEAGDCDGENDFAFAPSCDCGSLGCYRFYVNGCDVGTDLRGDVKSGSTVEVRFTIPWGSRGTYSLVSYVAPSGVFEADRADEQRIYQAQSVINVGPGTYTLKVQVPNSYFQVDFVCGLPIDRFGAAGSNVFYTPQGRLIGADNGGKAPAAQGQDLGCGDTANADFWASCKGQDLIKSLNGSSSSKKLGNWLAATLPNLGGWFAGKTNASVASTIRYLSSSSLTRPWANLLSAALSAYVTDSDLAGMVATRYGFKVSATGAGAKLVNVGNAGSTFGVANNSSLSLLDLLKKVDAKSSCGLPFNGNVWLTCSADGVIRAALEKGQVCC